LAVHVLGVRVGTNAIFWAVVSGTREVPVVVAQKKLPPPKSFSEPAVFAWYHSKILGLIEAYKPTVVSVRYPEHNARGSARKEGIRYRFRVEGIVVAAAASQNLTVETPTIVTMTSQLGSRAKEYLDENAEDMRGIDLSELAKEPKEAIVTAVCYLPEKKGPSK
jgi:hypothetical protein